MSDTDDDPGAGQHAGLLADEKIPLADLASSIAFRTVSLVLATHPSGEAGQARSTQPPPLAAELGPGRACVSTWAPFLRTSGHLTLPGVIEGSFDAQSHL